MTDSDTVAQVHRLRAAAFTVLELTQGLANDTDPLGTALTELRNALAQESPAACPNTAPADPARHLVSKYDYRDTEKFPITLATEAARIRRELAGDRTIDTDVANRAGAVVVTELRGMIIGGLLAELAARLSSGPAFGSSRDGETLAAVVTELSWELLDQTFVGRG